MRRARSADGARGCGARAPGRGAPGEDAACAPGVGLGRGCVRARRGRLREGGGLEAAPARAGPAEARPACRCASARGVPSGMSSLGWESRGAAGPLARSSRPSNLNHADPRRGAAGGAEGRREGTGPRGGGAAAAPAGVLGPRSLGTLETPSTGGGGRRLIDSVDVRGGASPQGGGGGGS